MSDLATLKKQLKIKSGSSKRLLKENGMYRQELEAQQGKVDKLVGEGMNPDEWELKNAKRMLIENETMVADSQARLGKCVDELRGLVMEARKREEMVGDEDFLQAEEALELASV